MQLKFVCPRWGAENFSYEAFFTKAKEAGYEGVEFSLPSEPKEKAKVIDLLKQYELLFVAQHWETNTSDFEAHKKEYKQRLLNLADAKPYFINTHTGKDYFSFDQNIELIAIAEELADTHQVKIIHETHRGRFSFAAHIATNYFKKLPGLRITIDFSHWCNVAESFLEDQLEAVNLAIERTDHVHARVGFPEGPQIPDPRAPEWKDALICHVKWWKQIVDYKRLLGEKELTLAPEFGPYPYMQIIPYTREPIANQWDINVFMMNYLKETLTQ